MKKILVTGGLGFIGSNFIRYMLSTHDDVEIVNWDFETYASNELNLEGVDKNRYQSLILDISDGYLVKNYLRELSPDIIVNFAASSHVDNSIKDADSFINTNTYGVYNILEAIRGNENIKKFIQIGTDESYGSIAGKEEANEKYKLNPSSPYSASKASADMFCNAYIKTYRLPVIIMRFCNNYGPRQHPEKLIPLFITNLMENKKVPVYGTGKNTREWMYVEDTCRAIDLIIEKGEIGEIYNVGTGFRITNNKVTEKILEFMGMDESYIDYVEDRKGHDFRYAINSDKIRQLGWNPKVNFEEGLKSTVDWYKNNKKIWKNLKE